MAEKLACQVCGGRMRVVVMETQLFKAHMVMCENSPHLPQHIGLCNPKELRELPEVHGRRIALA